MIDTALGRFRAGVERVGPAELKVFRSACRGPVRAVGTLEEDAEEVRATGWVGNMPPVGPVRLDGSGSVYFGRSLSNWYQEVISQAPEKEVDNGYVLSAFQSNLAWQTMTEAVTDRLPFLIPETCEVRRADPVYDRRVGNSMVVLRSVEGAMKPTRKGCSWFRNAAGEDTGIMMAGGLVAHRLYDKGLQLHRRDYVGVLRSEEQLRAGSVGLSAIYDTDARAWKREEVLTVLNERYLDVAFDGALDVSEMVKGGEYGVALLTLHPELLPAYRNTVKERAYYKMKKKVREARASAVPVNLRVPEEAWQEGGYCPDMQAA